MPLLQLKSAELHFGTHVILDHVDLVIEPGDRLGLLGRNGAGKTTLLKLLADDIGMDSGERWVKPGTRVSRLEQELPLANNTTVYDAVADGLAGVGKLISDYHHLIQAGADADLTALERVQTELEAADGWQLQTRVETLLSQLELDGDVPLASLSGGWRRRVALARALVCDPELLLLDEPTNHLDLPAIEWLEQQLQRFPGAIILITHDRRFLQNVATSICELDRGHLMQWRGDYRGFLQFREQQLEAQAKADALFDKRLAEEEVWIRQGIKARRTRNEGRVRALKAMREERSQRRTAVGRADFTIETADRSGKIVAELEDVSLAFGDTVITRQLSTIIQRGDRVGIVGPNGAGKSSLVKLLLGEIAPDGGHVTLGSKLEIAYSDQLRGQLDPEKNLIDNVCGGREFIDIGGKQKHAISYLGDFLFTPERVRTPVKALSGGERNRAVLAHLFSKPANLLVLDEPTNDLDIETLELLEEILLAFEGTLLLVSHDRDFMDNVVTSLLVMEGNGRISEQAGGFSDWEARGGKLEPLTASATQKRSTHSEPLMQEASNQAAPSTITTPQTRKLSYKEKRELESLPGLIESLEEKQAALEAETAAPDFYQRPHTEVQGQLDALSEVASELEKALERWTELEDLA